jgi:hypothetical protein
LTKIRQGHLRFAVTDVIAVHAEFPRFVASDNAALARSTDGNRFAA